MSNVYVFDTNVLVSALLFANSSSRKAFEIALDIGKIIISKETVGGLHIIVASHLFVIF
ncbi:hypothetical protein Sta7437_2201 [Stanieria cyanosphaera PCC 7437]|uniref:PIN domain-containing protein n=1 Tax=Stanieria cyanosphaera (strain ATCC 29371 / PCC 7437) TaxID=111780 RepID=K9XUK9_STAC7|nr:hypothetical protein Sta7437_2201 [Stanieria cyanosphaera PCC 7437]